jgi:hypothetical protein
MKKYKVQISLISIVAIIFILIITYIWIHNTRSIYYQIESSINDYDHSFKEILHVHVDQKRTLVFYSTINEEISVVTLNKKLNGFKLKSYINKTPLITDKDISWQGTEKSSEDIHLLYGMVQNQETTQIIINSEGNQVANIIKTGSNTFWYALMNDTIHLPITIQTFNKNGKKLYETGDINFWNDNL